MGQTPVQSESKVRVKRTPSAKSATASRAQNMRKSRSEGTFSFIFGSWCLSGGGETEGIWVEALIEAGIPTPAAGEAAEAMMEGV